MRIIQLLPTISYGDAVSNDTIAIHSILQQEGYESLIYAEQIGAGRKNSYIRPVKRMEKISDEDIIIYHLSTGTDLNYQLARYAGKKIIVFHNITPPSYFAPYSKPAAHLCADGIRGARFLADKTEYCIADSEYNKETLWKLGFRCHIDVLPIIIPFEDYEKKPDYNVLQRYASDGMTNILFSGRIAPNKKQEDVIASFSCYQKYYNPNSRLFLVGSDNGMEVYTKRLKTYARRLRAKNVIFTGHVSFAELLAYYRLADLFLCESEHEGFCVPLVEAMYFDIPIVAYDAAAIGETLGGSGFLIKKKNHGEIAGVMNHVLKDQKLKKTLLHQQNERRRDFSLDKTEKSFLKLLEAFLRTDNERYEKHE